MYRLLHTSAQLLNFVSSKHESHRNIRTILIVHMRLTGIYPRSDSAEECCCIERCVVRWHWKCHAFAPVGIHSHLGHHVGSDPPCQSAGASHSPLPLGHSTCRTLIPPGQHRHIMFRSGSQRTAEAQSHFYKLLEGRLHVAQDTRYKSSAKKKSIEKALSPLRDLDFTWPGP